ncbi:MAG TPA: UDP-3-O-(3-hydroxymyristoyl)glucosamine N-acyltransferase [Chthoniobacterales bacterium]
MPLTESTSFLTAAQVAETVQGEVVGDPSTRLTGFAAADAAKAGDLTFAEKAFYLAAAEQSAAAAILVAGLPVAASKVLIRVRDARVAMARVLPLFFPEEAYAPGQHPSSVVDPSAQIDATAHIGPHCTIGPGVRLGARALLMGGNRIGRDCVLGDDVCLHPNVVLYPRSQIGRRVTVHAGTVIGSDGYGYVLDGACHRKMLQAGDVTIGDDVEIGANAAIDRGALGSTVIGQGTKIDNLVHIAHNVVIGKHCLIMGQVGFAGSTHLGDYSVIASQSGIAGHLKLGRQSTVGAKSGVMRDVPDGGTVLGIPAAPGQQAKRQFIALKQLPDLIHRLRELERQVEVLTAKNA